MLLIQISAAQGPAECELAVKYTLQRLLQDAKQHAIGLTLLDSAESRHGYLSVLLQADGESVQAWQTVGAAASNGCLPAKFTLLTSVKIGLWAWRNLPCPKPCPAMMKSCFKPVVHQAAAANT